LHGAKTKKAAERDAVLQVEFFQAFLAFFCESLVMIDLREVRSYVVKQEPQFKSVHLYDILIGPTIFSVIKM